MLLKENNSYMSSSNLKYLNEDESYIPPYSIPVFESYSLQNYFINWDDISNYSNIYGSNPIDTYNKICESNNMSDILVCVNEEDIIFDNTPLKYFDESHIVLRPVSKNTDMYKYLAEACEDYILHEEDKLESFMEETNNGLVTLKISDDNLEDIRMGRKTANDLLNPSDKKFFDIIQDHLKNLDSGTDYNSQLTKTTITTDGKKTTYIKGYSRDRKFLGRAVASLRSLYKNWLQKYNMEQDKSKKSMIKSLLAKIMNFIDRIMVKLQNKLS